MLPEDTKEVTEETLCEAIPEINQQYYYKGFTLYLSFMNHKWVEKRLKKNINLTLEDLVKDNA